MSTAPPESARGRHARKKTGILFSMPAMPAARPWRDPLALHMQ
jgi:hypothetical protein